MAGAALSRGRARPGSAGGDADGGAVRTIGHLSYGPLSFDRRSTRFPLMSAGFPADVSRSSHLDVSNPRMTQPLLSARHNGRSSRFGNPERRFPSASGSACGKPLSFDRRSTPGPSRGAATELWVRASARRDGSRCASRDNARPSASGVGSGERDEQRTVVDRGGRASMLRAAGARRAGP
jgi:hypothetical protein